MDVSQGTQGMSVPPAVHHLAIAPLSLGSTHATAWIEVTRRRHEIASVIDIAKRPGAIDRLSRLLGD
ncbi:hypothetical protein [Albidovulum sp.]|uniref:hypothetical protein n=1 Tax=Albidovulum sp. TaxID=1872424 RepID=UPI003527BC36